MKPTPPTSFQRMGDSYLQARGTRSITSNPLTAFPGTIDILLTAWHFALGVPPTGLGKGIVVSDTMPHTLLDHSEKMRSATIFVRLRVCISFLCCLSGPPQNDALVPVPRPFSLPFSVPEICAFRHPFNSSSSFIIKLTVRPFSFREVLADEWHGVSSLSAAVRLGLTRFIVSPQHKVVCLLISRVRGSMCHSYRAYQRNKEKSKN